MNDLKQKLRFKQNNSFKSRAPLFFEGEGIWLDYDFVIFQKDLWSVHWVSTGGRDGGWFNAFFVSNTLTRQTRSNVAIISLFI